MPSVNMTALNTSYLLHLEKENQFTHFLFLNQGTWRP